MLKNIIIPKYIYRGIIHNDIAFPKRYRLFGADTETVKGEPYTFQVSSDGVHADIEFVDRDNVLDKFLSYIEPKLLEGQVNVMYFHNLSFDLWVLLKKYQYLSVGRTRFEMDYHGVDFKFIISKVHFGRIKFPGNKCLTIIDSYAFFVNIGKASLGALAEKLELPHKKQERLPNIGEKKYKPGTEVYRKFVEYAKADAVVEWHLGNWIVNQYKKYNTRVCVSSPQFSMRVFRHYFMKKGDNIAFPPPNVVRGAVLSYHGGKNGFYCDGVTVVKDCREVDVVSMYPYAMREMPNFLTGEYRRVEKFTEGYEGVYCVSGKIKNCKYPVLFSHDFKPLRDRCSRVWVTSYELREALKHGEIVLRKIYGYIWVPDGKAEHDPFTEFVDYFFRLKDTAKNNAERTLAKLILNSLYGKMIQTIPEEKEGEGFKADMVYNPERGIFLENKIDNIFLAGGMFNPFIATLITGFARAYLHRLEHKYKALHSSTDSVKTVLPVKENPKLGGIKLECRGKCILFRNKLYLHYDQKGELKKYALHGFSGRADELSKMFAGKRYNYSVKHMFKVREAFRQKRTALSMETVDKVLHGVDFSKVTYI